jgi:hypothetical protein
VQWVVYHPLPLPVVHIGSFEGFLDLGYPWRVCLNRFNCLAVHALEPGTVANVLMSTSKTPETLLRIGNKQLPQGPTIKYGRTPDVLE